MVGVHVGAARRRREQRSRSRRSGSLRPAVSTDGREYEIASGGRTPVWSPDRKQLFFHDQGANRLFVVDIRTTPSVSVGPPTLVPIEGTVHPVAQRNYDVTPDGKQLIVVLPASLGSSDSTSRPAQEINVVLNWFEELKARVPTVK